METVGDDLIYRRRPRHPRNSKLWHCQKVKTLNVLTKLKIGLPPASDYYRTDRRYNNMVVQESTVAKGSSQTFPSAPTWVDRLFFSHMTPVVALASEKTLVDDDLVRSVSSPCSFC